MAIGDNKTDLLVSTGREYMKSYAVYVGGLMTEIYEAPAHTVHGGKCLRTQYEFSGTDIIKTKESESTWDSSWDI